MADEKKFANEKLTDEQLDGVAGGSLRVREDPAKKAGIYLLNKDGTDGKWGYLWNDGDYYWRENKITAEEANDIIFFMKENDHQPYSLYEVKKFKQKFEDQNVERF